MVIIALIDHHPQPFLPFGKKSQPEIRPSSGILGRRLTPSQSRDALDALETQVPIQKICPTSSQNRDATTSVTAPRRASERQRGRQSPKLFEDFVSTFFGTKEVDGGLSRGERGSFVTRGVWRSRRFFSGSRLGFEIDRKCRRGDEGIKILVRIGGILLDP